jgi:hypothetical protein
VADYGFDGRPLVAGDLLLPIAGAWTADVYFADPDAAPAVGTTAALSVLGTSRTGTVTASGIEGGYARARLVGGRGRLDAELAPTEWRGYLLGQIARDCLSEAGEGVGSGWDSLTTSCVHWQRSQGPLRECLRRIARLFPADTHWRCADDGSVALVTETWPAGTAVDTATVWPHESCAQWWPTDGTAAPGQTLTLLGAAHRLLRVEYRWSPHEVTCRGWY